MTCLPTKFTLPVINQLIVEIEIKENPYCLHIEDLFTMAARINKKRSFLFVSKVLGKHIPIDPKKGILTGALLANRYMETVKGVETGRWEELLSAFLKDTTDFSDKPFIDEKVNPIIIGFAETATALGHAFFQYFQKADFFHTTREQIADIEPVITFEEEHSHATSHRCYVDESILRNNREIILVDDEMTTGKTNINIIRSIHERFPRKTYTVVSILDWRSDENVRVYDELEKELGIVIHSVSLLKGKMNASGNPSIKERSLIDEEWNDYSPVISPMVVDEIFPGKLTIMDYSSETLAGKVKKIPFLQGTGRFGLSSTSNKLLNQELKEIGKFLAHQRSGEKTLCLGTGEFMYLPMKLASFMGSGVHFHSTTRSPIYVEKRETYGAQYGLSFQNPEDKEIAQYVYNIPPNEYDELFLFYERAISAEELQPFLNELKKTKINHVKVLFFNGGCENE